MSATAKHLLLLFLALLSAPVAAHAQTVEIEGGEGDAAVALAHAILTENTYTLLARDTVLPAASRLGDVVVVGARVAVEGRIDGRVAVLGGDFFIRPGAFVTGPIAVIGGGAYPSGLAEIGEILELHPRYSVAREQTADGVVVTITAPEGPGILRIPMPFGVALPTYDRVDGLSLRWRGALASPGDTSAISLHGTAGYAFERRRPQGALELRVRPTYRTLIALRASRATRTMDAWIRGDLENSLAALAGRSDARNYFESDELALAFSRTPPPALVQGEGFVIPSFLIRASQDRSLPAGEPWSLLDRDRAWRPNPAIDDGTLASVSARLDGGWRGVAARFSAGAVAEWAPGVGDFEFAQLRASGQWWMLALRDHQLEIQGYGQIPLGGGVTPRQRWSFVGGPGTLPVLPMGSIRGDHVVYLRSTYQIPLRAIQLPVVGAPILRLSHAAGTAWVTGESRPPLEQNLAAGLRLLAFDVMVNVDPTRDSLDPTVSFSVQLPFGTGGF